jgi:hypothetical protein
MLLNTPLFGRISTKRGERILSATERIAYIPKQCTVSNIVAIRLDKPPSFERLH